MAAPTRPSRSSAAARPSSPRALRPASSPCKAPGQLPPLLCSSHFFAVIYFRH
jgi:hypothetical protein